MQRSIDDIDGMEWQIYCNGKLLDYAIEADDKEGWARIYKKDENGMSVWIEDEDGNFDPVVETVYGKIEFREFK